jgi:alkylated DNA repair protein alkB homolog 6
MSHFDGPLFYPTITTVSVGSHAVLEFHKPRNDDEIATDTSPAFKLLVEPRSLLILQDDLYQLYMHSISEIEEDDITDPSIKNLNQTSFASSDSKTIQRSTRFSLTIRNVPKTTKLKLKFGK